MSDTELRPRRAAGRIECVPTCLEPGEAPRYSVISAGEHIKRKIERSHETA